MSKHLSGDPLEVRSILIVNLGGIGDILLSSPAVAALKKRFSNAKMVMLLVPGAAELARNFSFVDEVIEYRFGWKHLLADLAAIASLRRRNIDLLLNMRTLVSGLSALKMRLLVAAIAPRIKAGRDTAGRGRFFDISIVETDAGIKAEMDYDRELVEVLGCSVVDRSVTMPVSQAAEEKIGSFLRQNLPGDPLLIGLHPGGRPSRRWPKDSFVRLIGLLRRKFPSAVFVLTAGPQEGGLTSEIAAKAGSGVIDCAGRFSLQEAAALIRACRVYVSNDTANMHIAAALKVPLVAMFGPGDLKRFDPRYLDSGAIVIASSPCRFPCNKVFCDTMECLKSIEAEQVAEKVTMLLQG